MDADGDSDMAVTTATSFAKSMAATCEWCATTQAKSLLTMQKRTFCSERCFSMWRRAAFKRNRGCAWCRKTASAKSANPADASSASDSSSRLQFCK